jgi:hypothetical protein
MMTTLFGDLAPWFTVPALLGTGFLVIQLILGQLGGDGALDLDLDIDVESDHPGAEFGWLSVQSISAFLMGYGWMGFAAFRYLGQGFSNALIIGVLGGVGASWLVVWLIRSMLKLQHSGNVSIQQAVGLVGEVYVTVPEHGKGRGEVVLVINNTSHSYNAIQEDVEGHEPIATHTRVKVLRADTASNILIVEPA